MITLRSPRVLMLAALLLLPACASSPQPQALPPQTMAPTPPETAEPISNIAESLEPLATPEEIATPEPPPAVESTFEIIEEPATTAGTVASPAEDDPLTVVLDPGTDEEEQPRSLFEASTAEKSRRMEAGESTIVLTNKTLKDYSKGQLTFAEDEDSEEGAESADQDPASPDDEPDEEYWRNRVYEVRLEWRESLDRIVELEADIARLRRQFYAEDDPFYRDSQIKPAWDQALVEIEESRRKAEASEGDLEDVIDEGRRAGALPGWLREGIELEPTEEELQEQMPHGDDRIHEPSEPVVAGDDGDGGP